MKPIYRTATYIFDILITINDNEVDIRNDTVTVYISKIATISPPIVTKVADAATYGLEGRAIVELSPTDTNLTPGSYRLQALWELDGTTRKFVVIDTAVKVKARITPSP